MKTSLTLLFSLFIFPFVSLGQNFEKHDKIILENRSGQDTQDSTLTWYWDAEIDVWELSRITYYTSDLNNNILSKRTITWDGSQWINLDLESLTYDDFNNVTS